MKTKKIIITSLLVITAVAGIFGIGSVMKNTSTVVPDHAEETTATTVPTTEVISTTVPTTEVATTTTSVEETPSATPNFTFGDTEEAETINGSSYNVNIVYNVNNDGKTVVVTPTDAKEYTEVEATISVVAPTRPTSVPEITAPTTPSASNQEIMLPVAADVPETEPTQLVETPTVVESEISSELNDLF